MFFYERREKTKDSKEDGVGDNIYTDGFNTNNVVRSVVLENGTTLVLLNDMHERLEQVAKGVKNGKMIYTKERNTYQSECILNEKDGLRFRQLTSID